MRRKYRFLRIAPTIFRVIGWIVLVVGIAFSIAVSVFVGFQAPLLGGIGAFYTILGIVYSVLGWAVLLALAEVLCLLIDLEQNTRETAESLRTERADKLT